MENYNHDLIHQLSEKLDSIWRYGEYIKNVGGACDDCKALWQKLKEEDGKLADMVKDEIVKHIQEGRFN